MSGEQGGRTTIATALRKAAQRLGKAGVENPARDARILLAGVLQTSAGDLISAGDEALPRSQAGRFDDFLDQRTGGKPVHRILGFREFCGRRFEFNADCLEPRPETELLVEQILEDYAGVSDLCFCEVGTGSGVICISLLAEMPQSSAVATDIVAGAISATRSNGRTHGVGDRLQMINADCLDGVDGPFDFIVSNPPYIETDHIAELSTEVKSHDPITALDGGADGLDFYRRLLKDAHSRLVRNGRLYLETGHGQHAAICTIADEMGWGIVVCYLDLSGLERIVVMESRVGQCSLA